MSDTEMASRPMVREWVAKQRGILEAAQANGTLARAKLDLRDAVERAFPAASAPELEKLRAVFNEELDAFCSDMRLASVTVQQQVERKKKGGFGKILLWIFGLFVVGFVIVVIYGSSIPASQQQPRNLSAEQCNTLGGMASADAYARDNGVLESALIGDIRNNVTNGNTTPQIGNGEYAVLDYIYNHSYLSGDDAAKQITDECNDNSLPVAVLP